MESGFVDTNGQRLYYEIDGEGENLLLFGGLGQDITGWAFQIPRYREHFRVIAFDNRDVGRSSEAKGPYDIGDMAEDAAGLMDQLGIERAHLLGYSMGGIVAQELVLRYPAKALKLVLACTSPQMARYQIPILEPTKFICEKDADGRIKVIHQLFLCMTRKFLKLKAGTRLMIEMLQNPPFPQSIEAFGRQVDAAASFDVLDRLPSVKIPTLVLAGQQDILMPPWEVKQLADAIPGAIFEVLENGAHALLFEIPEMFNDSVVNFLSS